MSVATLPTKVVLPYAEALLEMGQSRDILEKITVDLSLISNLLSESDSLQTFLSNPLIKSVVKKNILQKIYFTQIDNQVLNFLFILIDRRRISYLKDIIKCYLNLADKLNAIIIANVFTAIGLTNLQKTALEQKLKNLTNAKEVKLVITINTELIGGLIIKIGSKVMDNSLSGQLNQITAHLNAVTS